MIIFRAIGIFLVFFFAGVPYYKLAAYHYKNKWLYGLLGMVAYYASILIIPFTLRLAISSFSPTSVRQYHFLTSLVGIISGITTCLILYRTLKSRWENEENNPGQNDDTVLDGNIGQP